MATRNEIVFLENLKKTSELAQKIMQDDSVQHTDMQLFALRFFANIHFFIGTSSSTIDSNVFLGSSKMKDKISQIVLAVESVFNVAFWQITAKNKKSDICDARFCLIFVLDHFCVPHGTIRTIVKRTKNTVTRELRRCKELQETDQFFAKKVAEVINICK